MPAQPFIGDEGRAPRDTFRRVSDGVPSTRPAATIREIIDSYDSVVIRAYALCRFAILRQNFLEEIGQYLPQRGRVLDLGCGFGLFSLFFAAAGRERALVGVDLDARRIAAAKASALRLGLENTRYECADALDWEHEGEPFDAIYMLDMIHHAPVERVRGFLERQVARLAPGGVLVIKEVSDRPAFKRWFTWLLDRLMVGWREPIRYWPEEELTELLRSLGLHVVRHRMKDVLPYPHVLYVARREP